MNILSCCFTLLLKRCQHHLGISVCLLFAFSFCFLLLVSSGTSLHFTYQVPVPELKQQIASITGILSEQQRLICRGRVLKDDQCLSAYRILFYTLDLVDLRWFIWLTFVSYDTCIGVIVWGYHIYWHFFYSLFVVVVVFFYILFFILPCLFFYKGMWVFVWCVGIWLMRLLKITCSFKSSCKKFWHCIIYINVIALRLFTWCLSRFFISESQLNLYFV